MAIPYKENRKNKELFEYFEDTKVIKELKDSMIYNCGIHEDTNLIKKDGKLYCNKCKKFRK